MEISKEFIEFVKQDILQIDEALGGRIDLSKLLELHKELDAKYQSCVLNWYQGLKRAYLHNDGTLAYVGYDSLGNDYEGLKSNLKVMKSKLEVFCYGMNASQILPDSATTVNVTTNLNLNITFEEARSKVENMTSLTDDETNEILDKITEIEEIVNSKDKKKTKWEKAKPLLLWIADKSFDIGMTFLPLFLKLQG